MGLVESFSGVRGVFGEDVDLSLCRKYATALTELLGPGRIVVGRDTRPSGQDILQALLPCLHEPIVVGVASTPAIQEAVRATGAIGGIIITASHNEPEYNGLKLLRADGALLAKEDMERVIARTRTVSEKTLRNKTTYYDALAAYEKHVRSIIGDVQFTNAAVLIDPNGGAACDYEKLLASYGVEVSAVNNTPGVFTRRIEPNAQSLAPLQSRITTQDFAAGFDCDADRVELALPDRLVSGNEVLALALTERLPTLPKGQTVVVNDATSQLVHAVAHEHGARVVESGVGEINVVDTMLCTGSVLGGEGSSSGAIVFPSRCRDGLLSVLLVLRYLSRTQQTLAQAVSRLPQFVSVRKNVTLADVTSAREKLAAWGKERGADVRVSDAIKIVFADRFAWMRASQTETGVVRVICDAPTKKEAEALLSEVCGIIGAE